jgi:hypothetical protein
MPGITVDGADGALRAEENRWINVRGASDRYTDAVDVTRTQLRQTFLTPDMGASLHSIAYWNILSLATAQAQMGGWTGNPDVARIHERAARPMNRLLGAEIDHQIRVLEQIRPALEDLKKLASRDGIPIFYDTNMLNHWQQPSDVPWHDILKDEGEDVSSARLVVPRRVIDELDRQKYGEGELARRAATAIRYLERTMRDVQPGDSVPLRDGVTLEVWGDSGDRNEDPDLAILRCAADLDNLRPTTGSRVLTNDFGMRLRARQMKLKVLGLPSKYRKPTASQRDCATQSANADND